MSCLFCRIVAGEIPAAIVHKDDEVLAFRDIAPKAPVHILVVPVRHVSGLAAASDGDRELLGRLLTTVRELATREGLDDTGYRVVANQGADGGQSVPHLHLHLLGGRAMAWPPG